MITDDTRINLPGLISATRTAWSGTYGEAAAADYDAALPRLITLCGAYAVPVEDENGDGRDDLDMLADLAAAGVEDVEIVRDIFDDPNAQVIA